jgi:predicted nucleic acid-binding protein
VKAVCDTSVLIAFDTLGKKEILYEIFSNIIIPGGVQDELRVDLMGFVLEEWITKKRGRQKNRFPNRKYKKMVKTGTYC